MITWRLLITHMTNDVERSYSENGYNVDTFTLRRTKREDGDESNNKFEALIMKESREFKSEVQRIILVE